MLTEDTIGGDTVDSVSAILSISMAESKPRGPRRSRSERFVLFQFVISVILYVCTMFV